MNRANLEKIEEWGYHVIMITDHLYKIYDEFGINYVNSKIEKGILNLAYDEEKQIYFLYK